MKNCSSCKEQKPFELFIRSKSTKDGFGIYCKPCRQIKKKAEYLRNRDKYLARSEKQRKENPAKVSEVKKQCYLKKPDHYKQMHKKYYDENRDAVLFRAKQYREENKGEIRKRDNAYKARNRLELNRKQLEYQKINAEKLNEYRRRYTKQRRSQDRMFAIRLNMRARFKFELAKRGEKQSTKTNKYLGCTWEFLRGYLASKFTDGMSWDNYGDWHVDHVIPLASAQTKDELIKLCHYSNLQPLWAFDNLSKGAKMPDIAA